LGQLCLAVALSWKEIFGPQNGASSKVSNQKAAENGSIATFGGLPVNCMHLDVQLPGLSLGSSLASSANADLQGKWMGSLTSSKPGEEHVVISAADAREITRLLKLLQPFERRTNDNDVHESQSAKSRAFVEPQRATLIERAQAIFSERSRRAEYLSRAMFGEPAWDMLLCLYILDGRRVSFGNLVSMIGQPMTTAVRWIDYLEKERLVARRPDPDDRRVVDIELLDRGREVLDSYLSSFPMSGPALG
jgi:DNA-binding MarR family transcriptional regulator